MSRKLSPHISLAFLVLAVLARPAAAVDIKLSTNSLSFFATVGTNPAVQVVNAYPSQMGAAFSPTVTASTNNGGSGWLAVSTSAGGSFFTSVVIQVSINSASLAQGDYSGQITVTQTGFGNSPQTVGVSLKVIPPGPYLAPSLGVINVAAATGTNAASLFLDVRNVGTGKVTQSFAATTVSGGSWIVLSAPIASTLSPDVQVKVDFATSALAAGFYQGTITVTASGATNSPLSIPVNLNVGSVTGPIIAASTTSISFSTGVGQNPAPRFLTVNNGGGGTLNLTLTPVTTTGGAWLKVAVTSTGTGGSVLATVSADVTGLAVGNYSGMITITDAAAVNSPQIVAVSLSVVAAASSLAVSSNNLVFSTGVGSFQSSSTVQVTNSGSGAINFTTATTGCGSFLTVSPTSGTTPATLTFTVNSTGLASGIFTCTVTISSTSPASTQSIAVTFGVGVKPPLINAGGIVNGASFGSQVVAPGEIVSIFGLNFGPPEGVTAAFVAGHLTFNLGDLSVLFDTSSGPLYFTNDVQINVQVPFELAGKASTVVQVGHGFAFGPPFTLSLRAFDPAIFVSAGRPAILNLSAQQVTTAQPAAAGDILTMFATGLGPLSGPISSGVPAPIGVLYNTATTATVTVGGTTAEVLFSGLAPTFVGLYQVNFRVPAGLGAGDKSVSVSIGGVASPSLPLALR